MENPSDSVFISSKANTVYLNNFRLFSHDFPDSATKKNFKLIYFEEEIVIVNVSNKNRIKVRFQLTLHPENTYLNNRTRFYIIDFKRKKIN